MFLRTSGLMVLTQWTARFDCLFAASVLLLLMLLRMLLLLNSHQKSRGVDNAL
jgi:hypothetical protein